MRLLGLLFLGQEDPGYCLDTADVSDNGTVDISDAIGSLGFQFLGEKEPAAPLAALRRRLVAR